MILDPKSDSPILDSNENYDPSGILGARDKGIYITLSSPTPLEPWWEGAESRPLGEVIWIENEEERADALAKSLPPFPKIPPN